MNWKQGMRVGREAGETKIEAQEIKLSYSERA